MKEHNYFNLKSNMRFEDIFLQILREQEDDDDHELDFLDAPDNDDPDNDNQFLDHGIHGFDDGEFAGGGEDEHNDADDPQGLEVDPAQSQANRPQKLSRTQQIKAKWKIESPGTPEQEFTNAVSFFNERKDRLKPYKPYGTRDERTGNFYINLPEIASLLERFPNMESVLTDPVRMKDMANYSWEQMSFYMHRFFQQAIEEDDENFIKGDYTEDQRIEMALQRWTKPYNRVYNENNTIVYKVECKSEAIALGALEHALWRKYQKDKKTVPQEIQSITSRYTWGYAPWCIAWPIGGLYGDSLWTNYRPGNAFYFVLDNNRPEYDNHHIAALQPLRSGGYDISPMSNMAIPESFEDWSGIENIYPQFRGKKDLFPYFGTTARERKELTLDVITFRKGDPNDFAIQPDAVQRTYIENNRYVQDSRCFLTLSLDNRKLYIEKTRKEGDDYKRRFICTTPQNDPFAILNILKNQKLGGENLYKYLDNFILKTREHVPEGILAIKLSIIGTKWKRIMTDIENEYTLFTVRTDRNRYDRNQKYGIINPDNLDIIFDLEYFQTKLQSYMNIFHDENGVKQRKIYMFQRYARSINQGQGGDQRDYFYFLYLKGAMTDKNSEFYLKGKFFTGADGDAYMHERIGNRTLIKLD
jgi:hypothetical protein